MYPSKRCVMNFAIVVGTQSIVAVQILVHCVRTLASLVTVFFLWRAVLITLFIPASVCIVISLITGDLNFIVTLFQASPTP
jgi:hypothetical protein